MITRGDAKMQKINDRIILTIFTGSISALTANIFGYLSRLIHESTIIMPEVALQVFTKSSEMAILGLIIGNLWSFIVGGIHALLFISVLDYTGWRHLWWKSFAITNGGWLLGTGPVLQLLGIAKEADLPKIKRSRLLRTALVLIILSSSFPSPAQPNRGTYTNNMNSQRTRTQ